MEVWKDVVGYEDVYQVSNRGRVMRVASGMGATPGRILKPAWAGRGYLIVTLCRDGKGKRVYVHRLVLEAHVGPAPSPAHEGNHKNGDKTDNQVENLEWVTASENQLHACRILGKKNPGLKGEAHGSAKLTEEDVKEIRRLYATGDHTKAGLGRMFGVSDVTIGHIIRRKTWRHI